MGGALHVEPLAGVDLVGADDGADLVVEDFRRRAGQGAETGRLQPGEELGDRQSERRRALRHLQRREGVDVHLGDDRLDRPADRFVGGAGVVGMDAALQADFRRAAIPRLDRAARDFLDGEIVGRAAQILVRAALREGAELAPEVADVGVVDVAVDDVAHDVAADRAAQRVGGLRDVPVVGVARREQAHDVGRGEPFARCGALDDAVRSPASTLRASTSGAGGGVVLPGAQSSSRAKPSASLMRRTRVAISGASQVSASRA